MDGVRIRIDILIIIVVDEVVVNGLAKHQPTYDDQKKQTPKTWRRADDLACGGPTEAIIRGPKNEPKRLGKNLLVEDQIVGRPAATSKVLGATSVGYNTCPRIASWAATCRAHGVQQVLIA